jgi:hypothetical protein
MNSYVMIIVAIALSACASISNEEVSHRKLSIEAPKDIAIESQFTAEEPSPTHLRAFERRAMEKLKDFGDFLDIISESTYDQEFRQQAQSQARSMFIEHSKIRLNRVGDQRIDLFLGGLRENPMKKNMLISDISIERPLKETIGSLYEGILGFSLSMVTDGDKSTENPRKMKADFFLMKTSKMFGTNEKVVWEIFLGDIY